MKKVVSLAIVLVSLLALLLGSTVCYAADPNFGGNLLFYYNFDDSDDPLLNEGELPGDLFLAQVDYYGIQGALVDEADVEFNGTVDSMEGYGQALKLIAGSPSTTSWVQFPERILAQLEDEWTISFWYQGTENTQEGSMPISFCGLGIEFYTCFEVKNGAVQFFSTPASEADNRLYLDQNTTSVVGWHMYTVTCIKGEKTDEVSLYVDGKLVQTRKDIKLHDTYAYNQLDGNRKDFFNGIGRGYWTWPMSDGAIDEIRVYDYAFSGENVAELHTTPFEIDEPDPTEEPADPTDTPADPTNAPATDAPATDAPATDTPTATTDAGDDGDTEGGDNTWIIIVAVVVVVVIVAVGIVFINKKTKK